eukprot:6459841-Amphidinium_carterae.1
MHARALSMTSLCKPVNSTASDLRIKKLSSGASHTLCADGNCNHVCLVPSDCIDFAYEGTRK